jgi:hypothetical protein
MPIYTFIPPYDSIGQPPPLEPTPWKSTSFTATSQGFPYTITSGPLFQPNCQKNKYTYYVVKCGGTPLQLVDKVLNSGQSCEIGPGIRVDSCERYFVVITDPINNPPVFDHCCRLNSYFVSENTGENLQESWSASVGWLNDIRSVIPPGAISGIDPESRYLLLGANHTV